MCEGPRQVEENKPKEFFFKIHGFYYQFQIIVVCSFLGMLYWGVYLIFLIQNFIVYNMMILLHKISLKIKGVKFVKCFMLYVVFILL